MEAQKIHLLATAPIPRYGVVTAAGELADSANASDDLRIIGVADGGIALGAWGDVIVLGTIFNSNWHWTSGAPVYLNGTVLSETPPGTGVPWKIGTALTANTLFVAPGPVAGQNGMASVVAHEDIPAFSPVLITGFIADSSDVSGSSGKVLGIASAAIASGFAGNVVNHGEVTNPAWTWTTGDDVYLNGTGLASIPPGSGFVQGLGVAKGPTILFVSIGEPITL